MQAIVFGGAFCAALLTAAIFSRSAFAGEIHTSNGVIGFEDDLASVNRTIEVTMYDAYYEPKELSIKGKTR